MSWTLRLKDGENADASSILVLSRLDRKSPWETVALDATGQACRRAMVVDEEILPATGVVTSSYETMTGRALGKDEIVACDVAEEPVSILSSTKDCIESIEPATAEDILDHVAAAVYQVQIARTDPSIEAVFRAGGIFRTRFRPRATSQERTAFLVAREGSVVLILGERIEFAVATRETPLPTEEDAVDDDWDDEEWLRIDGMDVVEPVTLGIHPMNPWEDM